MPGARPRFLGACAALIVAWLASLRVRNYERGAPDDRRTTKANAKRRLADFRAGVYMQTLLRDPAADPLRSRGHERDAERDLAATVLGHLHERRREREDGREFPEHGDRQGR